MYLMIVFIDLKWLLNPVFEKYIFLIWIKAKFYDNGHCIGFFVPFRIRLK